MAKYIKMIALGIPDNEAGHALLKEAEDNKKARHLDRTTEYMRVLIREDTEQRKKKGGSNG